jgi:hypothetical protein
MVASKPMPGKKHFTVQQANSMLPLVRSIVRDIAELAQDLRDRQERIRHGRGDSLKGLSEAHKEELRYVRAEYEQGRERLNEYQAELRQLGLELKDPLKGLVDFPAWMNGKLVFLCWRLGEPDVGHWHDAESGFAGRQKLPAAARSSG